MKNWKGTHILVIGAARQGKAITRHLLKHGASVILTDQKPASELEITSGDLNHENLRFEFGGHSIDLIDGIDLVVVSGGVPLELPIIKQAIKTGIPISNDSQIFMEEIKARVIGITGSAGKTTTTVLVGEIAKLALHKDQRVWVGGNIGVPLIEFLEEIQPNDLVVLELSSFQLELMNISPQVAAVLNITPNHLDRHANMQAYIQAKTNILASQSPIDYGILNREDQGSWDLLPKIKGKLVTFGIQKPDAGFPATYIDSNNKVCMKNLQKVYRIMPVEEILLRGPHNILNALAACSISFAAGLSYEAMRSGIRSVKGIPHRLEFVRKWRGVSWINDSIATAPERSMAAINSFTQPLVLLLGGRDKKLPWQDLAKVIHKRVKHVILFGEARELIARVIGTIKKGDELQKISQCVTLKEAIAESAKIANSGDVVLLSPGGTSFDEFSDFEERGRQFKEWVMALK